MASLLEICLYPDSVLREKCEEVTSIDADILKLLDDMAETMYDAPGIGLAAPQIGVTKRITVIDVSEEGNELIELINPVIKEASGKIDSEEGCLSIPDYRDTIKRNETVKVEALNRDGELFEIEADGILSRCLQHEIDHLDGVLFVDKLSRLKRELFKKKYKKLHNL